MSCYKQIKEHSTKPAPDLWMTGYCYWRSDFSFPGNSEFMSLKTARLPSYRGAGWFHKFRVAYLINGQIFGGVEVLVSFLLGLRKKETKFDCSAKRKRAAFVRRQDWLPATLALAWSRVFGCIFLQVCKGGRKNKPDRESSVGSNCTGEEVLSACFFVHWYIGVFLDAAVRTYEPV